MDKQKELEKVIYNLLKLTGDNPDREGLLETPKRVAKAFEFWTSGYTKNPKDVMKSFNVKYDEIVVVKNIDFYSMCEHHLAPFYGQISIGYLPSGKVLGVSKFARLVEIYARRFQIQERLTQQIADAIMKYLKPQGVGVVCRGIHLCMRSRGVEKQNSEMITSVMLGKFRRQDRTKEEFMKLLGL